MSEKSPIDTKALLPKLGSVVGLARVVFAFLALGTIHLFGVVEGLEGYSYPIISSSLAARVWWHFATNALYATVLCSLVLVGFSAFSVFWRVMVRSMSNGAIETKRGLPDQVYSVIFLMYLMVFGAQYDLDLWNILTRLWWVFVLLSLFGIQLLLFARKKEGVSSYARILKEEYAKLPKGTVLASVVVLFLLGGAYEMGRALASSIVQSQNTQLTLRDGETTYLLGSLIDFNQSGVVFWAKSHNDFPIFIPMDRVKSIEFGYPM